MTMACYEDVSQLTTDRVLFQTTAVTILVTVAFVATKTSYEKVRQHLSKATVVVVGAGPVGLTAVLISALSGKAEKIILFDDKFRNDLINRPQQIALTDSSVMFLKMLGVDFDNIEGCWQNGSFFTKLGVFEEYVLGMVYRLHCKVPVDIRLHSKVSTTLSNKLLLFSKITFRWLQRCTRFYYNIVLFQDLWRKFLHRK